MANANEDLIWRGSPSQIRHLPTHLICLVVCPVIVLTAILLWRKAEALWLLCLLVAPLGVSFWHWLVLRSRVYELTSERLKVSQGILARRTDDLELYRVRDTTLSQSLLYRIFNKGDIVLNSTDTTTPLVMLECVPEPVALRDKLRAAVEVCRDRKRARVAELTGPLDADEHGPA
jgi:hypothetical protein